MKGDIEPPDIVQLLKNAFGFVVGFNDKVPATTSRECGNYLDHNLVFAKYEAEKFLRETLNCLKEENMVYPK
jgi:S-ribosylhomocysteine lyase